MSASSFFITFWPFIVGAAIVIFGYVFLVVIPTARENRRKVEYQHAGEPVLFWQNHENETDYWLRFRKEQARYIDANNRWAKVQTPVLPFPKNCEFEFEWFGEIHRPSTVGLTELQYIQAGERHYVKFKKIWDLKAYGAHGMDKMMEATRKQQVLADDADIWED